MIVWIITVPFLVYGQEERKHIREGYKYYMEGNFNEAEVEFRKAEEAAKDPYIARYNTSAALYQQNKLEESGKNFTQLMAETADPAEQAKLLHNLGNVLVQGQKYQEAVEAYKKSLKMNPSDDDTRYNLAYAMEKLRDQQQQQQDKQKKDQENQDQQRNDQQQQEGEKDQEQKDQQQKEEEEQQQKQGEQQEQEDQKDQQQMQELSQEEAERLLQAILQKERAVKEKVDEKKAKAAKIKTDKDW